MILQDFVMLGKTVPEPSSDGRVFVCSAGWSEELRQLVRIYPLAMKDAPQQWSVNSVAVERNNKDSRIESWRLSGDRSALGHGDINGSFKTTSSLLGTPADLLCERLPRSSIFSANESRGSLAVVQPDFAPKLTFSENIDADDHPQMSLFEDDPDRKKQLGAKRFPYQPRLQFSIDGRRHDLQLRDWGCYEWMRKRGIDGRHDHPVRKQLKQNPLLLVGNMNAHRNVWLVISVLRAVRQGDLF